MIAEAAAGRRVLGRIAAEWNAADPPLTTSRGNRWTGHRVGVMLCNPLYAGVRVHRKGSVFGRPNRAWPGDRYDARWPAILDKATHAAVVAAVTGPGRPGGDGTHLLRYPLSGLAYCGKCGARLRAAPAYGGARQLICPSRPAGCGGIGRVMGPVEEYVVRVVLWWLGEGGVYDAYLAAQRAASVDGAWQARIAEIDAGRARHAAALAEWEDQLFTGDFGEGIDRASAARLAARHRAADAKLAAERDNLARRLAAARQAPAGGAGTDWDDLTVTERRDWLARYVARVVIHPTRKGMAAFDLAAIEVIPGPWADGLEVTRPPGPVLVPRAQSRPPRTCELPGCGRPHRHGGLCGMHRRRQLAAIAAGNPDGWDWSPDSRQGSKPVRGRKCDLPGCGGPHSAGGLCRLHWVRKRKAEAAGRPDDWDRSPELIGPPGTSPGPPPKGRVCDLPGCGRPHSCGGLCAMHVARKRKAKAAGDPDRWDRSPGRVYQAGRTCTLPGCGRPHQAAGLCSMHRQRRDKAARAGRPGEWDLSPRPATVPADRAAPPALAGLAWALTATPHRGPLPDRARAPDSVLPWEAPRCATSPVTSPVSSPVLIERHTCPCCRGKRPDLGRDADCRDELTGAGVRVGGWDIRGRWFGVVVAATPRLGAWRRGETISWYEQVCVSAAPARPVLYVARVAVSVAWPVRCGWRLGGTADDRPYHAPASWVDGGADRARVRGAAGSGLDSQPLRRACEAGSAGCPAQARVGGRRRGSVARSFRSPGPGDLAVVGAQRLVFHGPGPGPDRAGRLARGYRRR